jgi:hypothetical protein
MLSLRVVVVPFGLVGEVEEAACDFSPRKMKRKEPLRTCKEPFFYNVNPSKHQ